MEFETQHDGLYGYWKHDTPYIMDCTKCGREVAALAPRFVLDDGKGPLRHNKYNSYLCIPCASKGGYELSKYAYGRDK